MSKVYPESATLTATSNPYLDFYRDFEAKQPKEMARLFDPELDDETREELFNLLDENVAAKYSWAIPDERALRIIKHYGPIVEMGAGSGYWGRLLQLRGVDVKCFDLHVPGTASAKQDSSDDDEEEAEERMTWLNVQQGTPKVLKKHSKRTLLLCYPDDFEDSEESMANECLNYFTGDTIIHIGEWLGQTVCLPEPWGRTSAPEFQTRLSAVFHKVLQVPLPSWHSSIDTLTVWKRTKTCIMDDGIYAYIPTDERIDLAQASPSTAHLLSNDDDEEKPVAKKAKTRR
ncbi:hypothetical protein SDRG_16749 [Saprolegnia diclina VS20]|uniref:Methyltransferase domain-containing protein n=1 Tax=Saprolegnia diclina (strain VS20) TaxID=1156394 RepID=T0PT26_SAPDV|nr:hypothetical protein SDRG_16749 [Saprolegnia diclina VS20]EQC25386.1 hypothetical protein SDRG_16749 [Saprolegnia diclina VS20]|eukprot:XP_008621188.1 hypothetical protein SDRG_16749 [Saprolegnia diclina VS20]